MTGYRYNADGSLVDADGKLKPEPSDNTTVSERVEVSLDVLASMLREQGVTADDYRLVTCGATTGHFVKIIALCDSADIAAVLAKAFSTQPASSADALREAVKLTIRDASYHLHKYRPHCLEALEAALTPSPSRIGLHHD